MKLSVKNVRAVCFDVDSTVCINDGLDELGVYMGKSVEVAKITKMAMDGVLELADALALRLNVLQLTKTNIESFKKRVPVLLTHGIWRLINALKASRIEVFLVSGGIYELVIRAAQELGISEDHVYVNRLIYSEDGRCIGFDANEPCSRSTGKSDVVAEVKSKLPAGSSVLMVGDGMTDAAACPPADAFIGFGGNVTRPAVQQATPFFFHSFNDMYNFFRDNGIIQNIDS